MPKSKRGKNIIFADAVSQIIHPRNKQLIQDYVEEKIFRLNVFEKKWKIRTSQDKFQIVSFSQQHKNMKEDSSIFFLPQMDLWTDQKKIYSGKSGFDITATLHGPPSKRKKSTIHIIGEGQAIYRSVSSAFQQHTVMLSSQVQEGYLSHVY